MLRLSLRRRCPGSRTRAERFILRGRLVSQRTRNETRHRVDHHHRRKLPAAQHEITNGYFLRSQMLRHAFVNAFVSPANKNDSLQLRETPRRFLPEQSSCGRHQHNGRLRISRARLRSIPNAASKQRLHRFKQRLRLHHHALATAERPLIHCPMTVRREHPQILHVHFDESRLSRAAKYSVIERPDKELRKDGDESEAHAPPV